MLLQSLLRPVLTPIMRGIFDPAQSVAAAWSPLSLWPDGILSPGMWISPRTLTSEWQDYTGTTPVVTPGTVADSANPVGLALDIRAGATVLTDPGNHMLQSTSAARPLMSARVNLLTSTEDLTASAWAAGNAVTRGVNTITATGTDNVQVAQNTGARVGEKITATFKVKKGLSFAILATDGASGGNTAGFDGTTGAYFASGSLNGLYPLVSYSCVTDTDADYWLASATFTSNVIGTSNVGVIINKNKVSSWGWSGSCDIGDVLEFGDVKQYEIGSSYSGYQRVTTDSDYDGDPAKFPYYLKFDGVDDGMETAAFTAGTLTSAMDCMIPVRRDSAAACVAGLYNGIADATKFFGMAESASGSGCVGSGAGTPTVWVDNAQLTGGTAVTRGTLHTALTVGDWHILEFRNLDLSTWTAAGFGLYTSYVFPGPRGDIFLGHSATPTEDKDAARQYLADYYGVTLP